MPSETPPPNDAALADPALRRALADFVRRRVPPSDVDDIVQTVLCDALTAPGRPRDAEGLRRWLLGIARHKVVDLHRRARREPTAELPEIAEGPPPIEARELVGWAERQAGSTREAQRTLAWMAREGEGEKLEAIAAEERVPSARVRQRVSRMRRWMKERWAAELAAVALFGLLLLVAWWALRRPTPEAHEAPQVPPSITPEPPSPLLRARALRDDALHACDRGEWRACLDGLDEARGLDPEGNRAPAIGAARAAAAEGLRSAAPKEEDPPDRKAPSKAAPVPTGKASPKSDKPSDPPALKGPVPEGKKRPGKSASPKVKPSPDWSGGK